jgi:hypothetical protein
MRHFYAGVTLYLSAPGRKKEKKQGENVGLDNTNVATQGERGWCFWFFFFSFFLSFFFF